MDSSTATKIAFREGAKTLADGAKSLPRKYFVSTDVFAKEQSEILSKRWLLVGHQSQIPKPGDYFLAAIAGESVIVTRDQKSQVRGFYNVCRHRGTRLKEDACGHASTIQCPYHAWTYRLDGRLVGAPHMDEVPGFDKADYSWRALNLALWEGFIFINLDENAMPLEEWFGPLNGKFWHWNMPIWQPAKRTEDNMPANG